MRYYINTFNRINSAGLEEFRVRSPMASYAINESHDPHGLMVRSAQIQKGDMNASLLAIARAGAGVNTIDVPAASERGICIFNTPGANANAVAEAVIGMMILAARNFFQSMQWLRTIDASGARDALERSIETNKKQFVGTELRAKRLGVIGLGNIGVRVANSALALGMQVAGFDPHPSARNLHLLDSRVVLVAALDEALKHSDLVTLHVPMNSGTAGLLGASTMHHIKSGAVVLNYARADVCDEAFMIKALESGYIRWYVTDFPSPSLAANPRALCTPHIGASTIESEALCARMAASQLKAYLERGSIHNSVNFPRVDAPCHSNAKVRIVAINRDIPNMLATISGVLGTAGINISSLHHESNGSIGYSLIDIEQDIPRDTLELITSITNVLAVRCIRLQ